ncbi:MAG: iron-sulfur cluster assembly accessory protein [Gammaproteobacteria bacterium]|nr:iron-sulfur cluster assembly accessory protein [Gammaproteobacteria bacterium]
MITVTVSAVKKIQQDAAQSGNSGLALRLAVRPEEEGFNYGMGFDEAKEEDVSYTFGDLSVVFSAEYAPYLNGATLDYVEMEPGQYHFIFINPNDKNCTPPGGEGGSCSSGGCSGCSS